MERGDRVRTGVVLYHDYVLESRKDCLLDRVATTGRVKRAKNGRVKEGE